MNRRNMIAGTGAICLTGLSTQATAQPRYRVPPEESPHDRTFMQWPSNRRVYPDPVFLDMTRQTIADIANAIADFEPVTLLAAKRDHAQARKLLSDTVTLWDIPTDDLWCRDAGPLFTTTATGDRAISHIQFNGWGAKQPHQNDRLIAARVAERLGVPLLATGLTGEAGGVEHDGHGLLLAHKSSWVIANRNPGQSLDQIETRLLAAYGADRMTWADGHAGDDITDYHIDSLARFTGPGRVLINLPSDPDLNDPFHAAALETYDRITAAGLNVEVIAEPHRPRIRSLDFVASYANYYVCNGAVIAAQFGDPDTDQAAAAALARHFPNRQIVMLNVDPLGELGGGIHCATQQMPRT